MISSCAKEETNPQSYVSLTSNESKVEGQILTFKELIAEARRRPTRLNDYFTLEEAIWNLEALINYENASIDDILDENKMESVQFERAISIEDGLISMAELLNIYDWLTANTSFSDGGRTVLADLSFDIGENGEEELTLNRLNYTPIPSSAYLIALYGFDEDDYFRLGGDYPSAITYDYCDGQFEGNPNVVEGGQPGVLCEAFNHRRRIDLRDEYSLYYHITDIETANPNFSSSILNSPLFEVTIMGINIDLEPTFETCIEPYILDWRLNYLQEYGDQLAPPGKELIKVEMNTTWFEQQFDIIHIYQRPTFFFGVVQSYTPPAPITGGG